MYFIETWAAILLPHRNMTVATVVLMIVLILQVNGDLTVRILCLRVFTSICLLHMVAN